MSEASTSKCPTAKPLAAPVPAKPTRCSEPMFEAKREAPITNQPASRPARKYWADVSRELRRRETAKARAKTATK